MVVLRVHGEVSAVVRFHSHGSIHQTKRGGRHFIVVNATSVVQRDFNALVRKRLLVTRIDNPHSANGFGCSDVEYRSAERPVDGERGPGFSGDKRVVGRDGRIGDHSRCVVPQIR